MLFISTALTFFGLYTSVVFTSPALLTPNVPILVSRKALAKSICGMNSQWVRRECTPGHDLTSWRDVCTGKTGQSLVSGTCPSKSLCQDILDDHSDQTIQCVTPEPVGNTAPRHKPSDPQIGSSNKLGVPTYATHQVDYEVAIDHKHSMAGLASVTAVLLNDDQTFAIQPTGSILGMIQGKNITVCQGSLAYKDTRASVCYPIGRHAFNKGDIIHFTWAFDLIQEGVLAYTIWPTS